LEALTNHGKANNLRDITVVHMHTEGPALYAQPDCKDIFRSKSTFMGANVRKAVAEGELKLFERSFFIHMFVFFSGRGDSIPIFLHEIPLLFRRKLIQPDVAIVSVDFSTCSFYSHKTDLRISLQAFTT
jgi:acyl-CoA hydrolase